MRDTSEVILHDNLDEERSQRGGIPESHVSFANVVLSADSVGRIFSHGLGEESRGGIEE